MPKRNAKGRKIGSGWWTTKLPAKLSAQLTPRLPKGLPSTETANKMPWQRI